jgi:hypothetical protein
MMRYEIDIPLDSKLDIHIGRYILNIYLLPSPM